MRSDGESLERAARGAGISSRVARSLLTSALRRDEHGRLVAVQHDRFFRLLVIPGERGPREVAVRSSTVASRLGAYAAAVQKYLTTGDASTLMPFRRERLLNAQGRPIRLLTNLRALNRLGHAGALKFESIYVR
jgi:hypothetical protein